MEAFKTLAARIVPLDRANIDTDAILPKQFMKSIHRTGFADNLFDEWRYLDRGEPGRDPGSRLKNPDFPLNQSCYVGAQIILTRENFGCGSSREHAVWALRDYGIRALIAPSFADIFFGNCFKNGLLPITLDVEIVDRLFGQLSHTPCMLLHINLAEQTITVDSGESIPFAIDHARKQRLLDGLDDIGLTMSHAAQVRAYEVWRRGLEPWLMP